MVDRVKNGLELFAVIIVSFLDVLSWIFFSRTVLATMLQDFLFGLNKVSVY